MNCRLVKNRKLNVVDELDLPCPRKRGSTNIKKVSNYVVNVHK
jgi:hypothetical protein